MYVGDKVAKGTVYVGDKTYQGTKYIGGKAVDGTVVAGMKATEGITFAGDKMIKGTLNVTEGALFRVIGEDRTKDLQEKIKKLRVIFPKILTPLESGKTGSY